MVLARAARLLIAVALLAAQHTALGHQIWHLGASASGNAVLAAGKDDPSKPVREPLCDLHAALGTVVGALDCASTGVAFAAADHISCRRVELRTAAAPRLPPASRGPPALL